MALYKRERTWWTDFSVNGQRYRASLDTTDWREAQKQERRIIAQAESGKISQPGRALARLTFSVAMERYLTLRLPRLARKTIQTERERSKPLVAYFAVKTVQNIDTDDVLSYFASAIVREFQTQRSIESATSCAACSSRLNGGTC